MATSELRRLLTEIRDSYEPGLVAYDNAIEALKIIDAIDMSDECVSYVLSVDGTDGPDSYDTLDEAREAAQEVAREGWETPESTMWVDVRVVRVTIPDDPHASDDDECEHAAERECVETITVAIDPPEPECRTRADGAWVTHPEHDWQDDGTEGFANVVRGNGGGVIMQYRCAHCGLVRVVDTWATRPDNGQQGLTSVRYSTDGES